MRGLTTFKTAALAAGVAANKLTRLDVAEEKAAGVSAALAELAESPSPLAEYLASPSPVATGAQLAEMVRADALRTTNRQALEAADVDAAAAAEIALAAALDDLEWLNSLMADVSATYAAARGALDKIEARWGTDNPDAATVVSAATATELKEYRARAGHVAALANVRRLIELITGLTPMSGPARPPVDLCGSHLLREFHNYTQALHLFTNDDGTLGTIEHARAELNRLNAQFEQNEWIQACKYSHPKPLFHPSYTLRTAGVALDRNGRPVDAADLITHDEFVNPKPMKGPTS